MFSYYGSKSKIVHLYPPPKHGLIIEPFAGSARYALRYFDREVLLIDKYPVIVEIWKYLQQASEKDILGLPKLQKQERIPDSLSVIEKRLLGFMVVNAAAAPQSKVCSFEGINVERDLKRVANNLHKIRHWKIQLGTYLDAPSVEATWFIDPPYFKGGEHYVHSTKQLDFEQLSDWCKSRKGQTIVCENSAASWLPFNRLCRMHGSMKATTEVFWTNERVPLQAALFATV